MAGSTRWSSGGRPDAGRVSRSNLKELEERYGKSGGTREMIGLVRVGLVSGWDRLISAVEEALRLG